jgi:predicted DCC family thiol-disulfide oxidoreductase YuxK
MVLIIYDGDCNLCTGWVQFLERSDRGRRFAFAPMQDEATLSPYGIAIADCALGVLALDLTTGQRWQGTAAIAEIGRQLPPLARLVWLYQQGPGLRELGDRLYAFVRDRRYQLFGRRATTYVSPYSVGCAAEGSCRKTTTAKGGTVTSKE